MNDKTSSRENEATLVAETTPLKTGASEFRKNRDFIANSLTRDASGNKNKRTSNSSVAATAAANDGTGSRTLRRPQSKAPPMARKGSKVTKRQKSNSSSKGDFGAEGGGRRGAGETTDEEAKGDQTDLHSQNINVAQASKKKPSLRKRCALKNESKKTSPEQQQLQHQQIEMSNLNVSGVIGGRATEAEIGSPTSDWSRQDSQSRHDVHSDTLNWSGRDGRSFHEVKPSAVSTFTYGMPVAHTEPRIKSSFDNRTYFAENEGVEG